MTRIYSTINVFCPHCGKVTEHLEDLKVQEIKDAIDRHLKEKLAEEKEKRGKSFTRYEGIKLPWRYPSYTTQSEVQAFLSHAYSSGEPGHPSTWSRCRRVPEPTKPKKEKNMKTSTKALALIILAQKGYELREKEGATIKKDSFNKVEHSYSNLEYLVNYPEAIGDYQIIKIPDNHPTVFTTEEALLVLRHFPEFKFESPHGTTYIKSLSVEQGRIVHKADRALLYHQNLSVQPDDKWTLKLKIHKPEPKWEFYINKGQLGIKLNTEEEGYHIFGVSPTQMGAVAHAFYPTKEHEKSLMEFIEKTSIPVVSFRGKVTPQLDAIPRLYKIWKTLTERKEKRK